MSVRLLAPVLVVLLAAAVQPAPQKAEQPSPSPPTPLGPDELVQALKAQLAEQESERARLCRKVVLADWRDVTNTTKRSSIKLRSAIRVKQKFDWKSWRDLDDVLELSQEAKFRNWRNIRDKDVRRQLQLISRVGAGKLGKRGRKDYQFLIRDLKREYNRAKVCDKGKKNCDLRLDPDLNRIMATSRDAEEMEHFWDKFRDTTGKDMRSDYIQLVNWTNIVAKKNGFSNGGDMWLAEYESQDFRGEVSRLWDQLTPLYEQLHAFVRGRLRSLYGRSTVGRQSPIPAHLLGTMWSDNWVNLLNVTKPFPEKHHGDVSAILQSQGYTVELLYRAANAFIITLGLQSVPDSFWENSVLEAPEDPDQEMMCRPRAWDFCKNNDVRVTACGKVTLDDLLTAHRKVGEAEYALLYSNQPHIYRGPAATGFGDAVGNTLALSVVTPKHLESFGLIRDENDPEVDLNMLMKLALEKLPALPYSYVADSWRWGLFSGDIKDDDLNCAWWKLRGRVQGVAPARTRSERDMDAGATYDIARHQPMIGRFVSTVLQFQLHETLCRTAGQYDPNDPMKPMYRCDIYNDQKAGALLARMMQLGRSKPWREALEAATGQRELSATALRDYFQPLEDWLRRENQEKRYPIGWKADANDDKCRKPTPKAPKSKSSKGRAITKDERERYDTRTANSAVQPTPGTAMVALIALFSALLAGL
ncbi:angiotensin-converting enzyme-like [Amphibalanus amphitrite]|uniref:angiotensin-converting enzyme-like n=1 Tax=Amphibalanus amphitrite TaxID=1232801 RepID=UPI001C92637D|nr:angiotensin-converting enzyme-like [Amphibalanus amphitrite]